MARIVGHLSVQELEARYRAARDVTEARHAQAIWLLAQGRTVLEVAAVLAFAPRWVTRLAARYNASGPAEALGDRRRHNGQAASLLTPELLAALAERVRTPPEDGGLWSGPKVAAWMAAHLGLAKVHPQRGWEALKRIGWSIQAPRPRHPRAATPEQRETLKKPGRGGHTGQGGASRSAGRGLGRRRASSRPEAGPAPGLGPRRPAAGRARASPLPMAARRHRLRPADQRRGGLVSRKRPLEELLRNAARRLRPAGRGGP
jgi:transposase